MNFKEELSALEKQFKSRLQEVTSLVQLEAVRVEFLSRKGKFAVLLGELPNLPAGERPECGQLANKIKNDCSSLFLEKQLAIQQAADNDRPTSFDPSFPGRDYWEGSLHPVTIVAEEICKLFYGLGYDIVTGPEIEIEKYNFEALNIPPDHPARDMQDTFYLQGSSLLRTHTSPVQARTMLARKPPLAIVAPGKVYRRDSDLTHTPMFHQIEGLLVAKNVSMADLRGTLLTFVKGIFGPETKMRFRPSFFPFTEPSAEADITCAICKGSGHIGHESCRVCKGTGWVEILGCGMVDPAVFEAVGYPEDISGFAFGLGIERVAMLKFGINDLRLFFQNDIRFLRQFGVYA